MRGQVQILKSWSFDGRALILNYQQTTPNQIPLTQYHLHLSRTGGIDRKLQSLTSFKQLEECGWIYSRVGDLASRKHLPAGHTK